MPNLIMQAEKCLQCKKPQCTAHCPVSTPIPHIVQLFKERKLHEAGKILFENNPLCAITSIVCPHEKNCAGNCVLSKKTEAVEFFALEQYIAKMYVDAFDETPPAWNGKRVGIIGAGPAGIAMAILLAKQGYRITLFDTTDQIGGVLRYGIPEFRLPKQILDRYDQILQKLGVQFRPNTTIGQSITIDDMFLDHYDCVFIATGTSRPNKLGLLGETLGHVHYAIDYLKSPERYHLGNNVAVIGAGNVALDAARMATRQGHTNTTIIFHLAEDEITGNNEEVRMALIDGVEFRCLCSTLRITDNEVLCATMEMEEDADGRRTYTENFDKLVSIPADSVIIALGQGPQAQYLHSMTDLQTTSRGLIEVDQEGKTSRPGVYAAGDIVTGPKTVIEAVALTKKIALLIDDYCFANSKK